MNEKIRIAKEFIELHNDEINEWYSDNSEQGWLDIYSDMIAGKFGECRELEGFEGEMEIEIDRFESKAGKPVIYIFDKQ